MPKLPVSLTSRPQVTEFREATCTLAVELETDDQNGVMALSIVAGNVKAHMQLLLNVFEQAVTKADAQLKAEKAKIVDYGKRGLTEEALVRTKALAVVQAKLEEQIRGVQPRAQQEIDTKVQAEFAKLAAQNSELKKSRFTHKVTAALKITAATLTAAAAAAAAGVHVLDPLTIAEISAGVGAVSELLKLGSTLSGELRGAMDRERKAREELQAYLVTVEAEVTKEVRAADGDKGKFAALKAKFKGNAATKAKGMLKKHSDHLTAIRQKADQLAKQLLALMQKGVELNKAIADAANNPAVNPKKREALANEWNTVKAEATKVRDALAATTVDYNKFTKWNQETFNKVNAAEAILPDSGTVYKLIDKATESWKAAEPIKAIGVQLAKLAELLKP